MTREIKFRAWTTDAFGPREMIYSYVDEKNYDIRFQKFGYGLANGSLIVMQFTGLLDRNGKEIYEDDVIQCYDKAGEESMISKVEIPTFYQECWSNKKSDILPGGLPGDWGTKAFSVEVIGNIYENSNLLK